MVVKTKEKYEKTRHVKTNDKSKKYNLRGQRNVRYHDRILSNKRKSYNLSFTQFYTYPIRKEYSSSLKVVHMLKKYYTENATDCVNYTIFSVVAYTLL